MEPSRFAGIDNEKVIMKVYSIAGLMAGISRNAKIRERISKKTRGRFSVLVFQDREPSPVFLKFTESAMVQKAEGWLSDDDVKRVSEWTIEMSGRFVPE